MKNVLILLVLVCICQACTHRPYDLPINTSQIDPDIIITHSIRAILDKNGPYIYNLGGDTIQFPKHEDIIISGIVIANDYSGNFYKRIIIADSTAAIAININAYNLHNMYPVGRRLFIKLAGLCLGYDGGTPVLGYAVSPTMAIEAIPASIMHTCILKGSIGHSVMPIPVSIGDLKSNSHQYLNQLITLKDVEFKNTGIPYAQPNSTTNRDLQDCNGNTIALRTSNYVDFAHSKIPDGNGSITAIYSIYTSPTSGQVSHQLVIRDTNDVQFHKNRCSDEPAASITVIPIDSLRRLYTNDLPIQNNLAITGVVISDRIHKNISGNANNIILQDGTAGILVRFSNTHQFNMGDSLVIRLNGAVFGTYGELLQVGNANNAVQFPISRAQLITANKNVEPKRLSIEELLNNYEVYESTLVKLNAVSIQSGTFSGNKNLTDFSNTSGDLKLYTLSGATFANANVPTQPVNIIGIVGRFNQTKQMSIRNLNDIE
jgi:hypothetical protein